MATISITSNEGTLESASAVLEVTATNPDYNQPALRIRQAGTRGGAASIRVDDPNPDIELIETDQVAPAGQYEIPRSGLKLEKVLYGASWTVLYGLTNGCAIATFRNGFEIGSGRPSLARILGF